MRELSVLEVKEPVIMIVFPAKFLNRVLFIVTADMMFLGEWKLGLSLENHNQSSGLAARIHKKISRKNGASL